MTDLIHRVNVGDSLTRTRRGPPRPARGRRRRPPLTYAELDAWVNRVAHGLAARGLAARRRARRSPRATAPSSSPSTTPARSSAWSACRSTSAGGADEIAYVLDHSRARGLAVETQLVARDGRRAVARSRRHRRDRAPRPRHGRVRRRARRPAVGHARRPATAEDDVRPRPRWSPTATRSATSTPRAPRRSRRAWSAATSPSTWSRCPRRSTRAGRPPTASRAMMPMFHTAQLNAFCTPAVLVGATIHVMRGFDPAALLDLIERERITQVFGAADDVPRDARAPVVRSARPVVAAAGGLRDGADARRAASAPASRASAATSRCCSGRPR